MPTVVHSQMCIFSWGLAPKSGLKSRGDLRVWTYRHYKRWTDGHRYHDITHWFAEVSHGKPQFQCFHYFIGGSESESGVDMAMKMLLHWLRTYPQILIHSGYNTFSLP